MDAAEYKHIVRGLNFLKYVSDAFAERRAELAQRFADPNDDYFIEDEETRTKDLEERDYYTEANVFGGPEKARWEHLRDDALETNEDSVRELGDEILKKIAVELTDNLRKSVSVDCAVRDAVRAKLRLMVRRILRKYKYPPDREARAIELVLQQAEILSEAWVY